MATQAIAGSVDKVLSAALPGVMKQVGLQVYNGHPFWRKIDRGSNKKGWEGDSIQAAVITSTYSKAASYQNDDSVNTSAVEPFTAVQYEMGGYQSSINIPGMKIRKVQSAATKLLDLMKTEAKLAIVDMVDLMSTHLFQTSNDAKGIYSLDTWTDASTTIAGLAGSSTWGGTTTASGSFASQGKNDLMTLYMTLGSYADFDDESDTTGIQNTPTISVTRRTEYQYYWNSLESSMRYTPGGKGDVNLQLMFMGTPVVADPHVSSGRWYMLKTDELYLYVHPDADFTTLPPLRESTQPDVWSRGIIWNGQLVGNTRRPQGKLTGITS